MSDALKLFEYVIGESAEESFERNTANNDNLDCLAWSLKLKVAAEDLKKVRELAIVYMKRKAANAIDANNYYHDFELNLLDEDEMPDNDKQTPLATVLDH